MANDTTFVKVDCKIPQTYIGHSNPVYYYGQPYSLSTWGANYTLQLAPSKTIISEPKTVELAAYGLETSDIDVKQIGDEVTVKSKKVDRFHAEICKMYTLQNTKLVSQTLKNGVLTLCFSETEDVKHYGINAG